MPRGRGALVRMAVHAERGGLIRSGPASPSPSLVKIMRITGLFHAGS